MCPTLKSFTDGLTPRRENLMVNNGLFALRAKFTRQRPAGWFRWLRRPHGDFPDTAKWYVDGSLMDGPSRLMAVTGYAIVVVAADGALLGCAYGAPPSWITTAGAAEAYAFYKVLSLNPFMPQVITDCLGVLRTLQQGKVVATAANRVNARLWVLIAACLDGATWEEAALRLTWMPAHGSRSCVGAAVKSDGNPVTYYDWRANRLADLLAIAAASRFRVAAGVGGVVATAMRAYEHAAAVAGIVTHAANNRFTSTTLPDGSYLHHKTRDAAPPPSKNKAASEEHKKDEEASAAAPADAPKREPLSATGTATTRTGTSTRTALLREAARQDARFVQSWHLDMAAKPRAPPQGPTAAERLEALRLRVRLKALQGA